MLFRSSRRGDLEGSGRSTSVCPPPLCGAGSASIGLAGAPTRFQGHCQLSGMQDVVPHQRSCTLGVSNQQGRHDVRMSVVADVCPPWDVGVVATVDQGGGLSEEAEQK